MPWAAFLLACAAAAVMATRAPEPILAALSLPTFLLLPGWGLARRYTDQPLDRVLLAFWISAVLTVPAVLVGVATGLGAAGALATASTITAATLRVPGRPSAPLPFGPRLGAIAGIVAVLGVGWTWKDTVLRPLDQHWWFPRAESAWEGRSPSVLPTAAAGWAERTQIGWEDAQAFRLTPRAGDPFLLGPMDGPVVLALRGPIGATLTAGDRQVTVRASVQEEDEEGLVPRYLSRGVVGLALDRRLDAGERLQLKLSDPARSIVYMLGSADAVWALHATGELRFVHYYQILNMVEQIKWARELFQDRRVTDVQPPLPSYALAAPLGVSRGELPTANLLFLLELALVALAGVACIHAWAPDAPKVAWLLPAFAAIEHGKLMFEPGSAMLPDTLYTLAVLGTVAALARPGPDYAGMGLLAQLTRYPGGFVAAVAGLLAGQPRRVAAMLGTVLGVALLFVVGGRLSGHLDGWKETVWWETFPEHWHGEGDPKVLLARAPEFYRLWLGYAGGTPILAAFRWPKGTRVCLGTALVYSVVLCTVDHTPTHYFLPLLHLGVIATACTAAAARAGWMRVVIPTLGLLGLAVASAVMPAT